MTAGAQTHFDVFMPGAFETFWTGTGVAQGEPWSSDPEQERGARELEQAWKERAVFRRGRGYTYGLRLPSIEAVVVLAEYADTCLHVNFGGDRDYSEIAAARKLLERIEAATDGRVRHDGWNVTLDGERVA